MTNRSMGLSPQIHEYICKIGVREHLILEKLRLQTQKMPERKMQISPEQGSFLQFLVHLLKPKNILEIGVYTGYSTLSMALSLPEDGKIIALDRNHHWTEFAQQYWDLADVSHKINLILGQAKDSLKTINQEFDLIYIDADKRAYYDYYLYGLEHLSPKGIMIFDNTLLNEKVIDLDNQELPVIAMREFNEKLYADPRIQISLIPLGDGLTLVQKL